MKYMKKQVAFLTAAALLTSGISGVFPKTLPRAASVQSLADFCRDLASQQRPDAQQRFDRLSYKRGDQVLYRDGKPVGSAFDAFSLRGGKLMISAEAVGCSQLGREYLTPEQAKELIGVEVKTDGVEVTLISPFQNARLIVKSAKTPALHGAVSCVEGYRSLHVLQYNSPAAAYSAYREFLTDDTIEYVDPDRVLSLCTDAEPEMLAKGNAAAEVPVVTSWGVADIGADSYCSWITSLGKSLPEITVAVLDTGVYAEHHWFEDRLVTGCGFTHDSDGKSDDGHGHGTHCSGIVVSSTPDNVKILPVKVLDDQGYGDSLEIYCGMMYAAEQNASVVSMSLGGGGESPMMDEAAHVLREKDIPCCVAAGNETDEVQFHHPANSGECIVVSAIDSNHNLAFFSNYGDMVDFAAPGVGILSAVHTGTDATEEKDGTSMATPFVAAACADVLSYDPTLNVTQLYGLLRNNAADYGASGFDTEFGWGEINLRDFSFAEAFCPEPVFSIGGGSYDEAVTVELSCPDAAAKIYYTTDDTVPTAQNGTRYSGKAIKISEPTVLRAVAVNDVASSVCVRHVYTFGGVDIKDPYVVKDGVLMEYRGGLRDLYLDQDPVCKDIKAVGPGAFRGNTTLSSVVLPSGVTEIGEDAFRDCTALSYLDGFGVTSIGDNAFYGCTNLSFVEIAELNALGTAAFRGCSLLNSIYMTNGGNHVAEIPEFAFADCASLTNFSLAPDTVSIGSYAFDGTYLFDLTEESAAALSNVRTIGSYAFRNSGISGTVSLDSVESLGNSCFSHTQIREMILPETVTELPAGFIEEASALRRFSAPGVTWIGDNALFYSFGAPTVQLEMDLTKITHVGSYAFCSFNFQSPAHFDSLTEIGKNAFFFSCGRSLYFPQVKNIEAGDFVNIMTDAIYFEHVETIAEKGIEDIKGIVVGDQLREIKQLGITSYCDFFLAGPADSPLENYAAAVKCPYYVTPSMRTEQINIGEEGKVKQYDHAYVIVNPLGFGDTAMQIGYTDSEGNEVLLPDTSGTLNINTFTPGITQYFIRLISGGKVIDTQTVPVQIVGENQDHQTVRMDETVVIDWNKDTTLFEGLDGQSCEVIFRYNAEEDGFVRLLLTRGTYSVMINGSDGLEDVFQPKPYNNSEVGFSVNAGSSYFLRFYCPESLLHSTDERDWLSAFRLTDKRLGTLRQVADPHVYFEQDIEEYGYQLLKADQDTLEIGLRSVGYFDSDFSNMEGMTLGKDYALRYLHADGPGSAFGYVIGIGDYFGIEDFGYQIKAEMVLDKPTDMENLDYSLGDKILEFTPKTAGSYTFYLTYPKHLLDTVRNAETFSSDTLWADTLMTIYDSTGNELGKNDDCMNNLLSEVTLTLKAGQTYTVAVSNRNSEVPIKYLTACVTQKIPLSHYFWNSPKFSYDVTGSPVEPSIILEDGDLVKDKDYRISYICNVNPGSMLVLIEPLNDKYTGVAYLTFTLLIKLTEGTELRLADLSLSQTETVAFIPKHSGSYTIYTDIPKARLSEILNETHSDLSFLDDFPDTTMTLMDEYYNSISFNDDDYTTFSTITADLNAGQKYMISIGAYSSRPERLALNAVYNSKRIGSETTGDKWQIKTGEVPDWNGEPVEPELTVTCGGTVLERDKDYTVSYLGNNKPGSAYVFVQGKGSYCGMAFAEFQIRTADEEWEGDSILIHPDEPFKLRSDTASYLFTLGMRTKLELTALDDLGTSYEAVFVNQETYMQYSPENGFVTLDPGTYTLLLTQDEAVGRELMLRTETVYTDLRDCSASASVLYYTGEALTPQITVTHPDGYTLTEGEDYIILSHEPMIENGLYMIELAGMGACYGTITVYCNVLPGKSDELPVLKTGENAFSVSEPGEILFLTFTARASSYVICAENIRYKMLTVYDSDGHEIGMIRGIGEQYSTFMTEPGEQYIVSAAFANPDDTGDFPIRLLSSYTFLYSLEHEYEKQVPFREGGAVPELTLRNAKGNILNAGEDYRISYIGGEKHYGKAVIGINGLGSYVGEEDLMYYIYPEDPEKAFMEETSNKGAETAYVIDLEDSVTVQFDKPNAMHMIRFTAPLEDGTNYYLSRPMEYDDVTAFVYLPDGSVLPQDVNTVKLNKGDTLTILVVSTWLECSSEADSVFTVGVSQNRPSYYFYDEESGMSYAIEDGKAYFQWADYDLIGVLIPDAITDPETGDLVPVAGLAYPDDDLRSKTFYVTPGSDLEQQLNDDGFCTAYADSVSKISGDVTGNGFVQMDDALTLVRWLTEARGMRMSDAAYAAADYNADGTVDMLDVTAILSHISENAVG